MAKVAFQIYSLGCKVNQYDAAVLRRSLEKNGFIISPQPNLVIINTCSVTKKAILKDRQLIKKIKRDFPDSQIIIMGCWPQTDETVAQKITTKKNEPGLFFWGVGKQAELLDKIIGLYPSVTPNKSIKDISAKEISESGLIASSERSRYFIKVGDGCNQFCSYCLIPFARGRLSSRPAQELIREIEAATAAGYREIVLSGIHLGRYGEDKKGKEKNLVGLLKEILRIKNLGRLRLSSIEINEITPELIKLISTKRQLCRHLHISLQSGSDKILKLMNRPYTSAEYLKKVKTLRKAMPEIAISTDIIVGFPGESAINFQETLDFARLVNFSKIHVFSFSAHEKTKAYKLPEKVNSPEIKSRSLILRKLSAELEADYQAKIGALFKGKNLSLILEKGGGKKTRVKTEFGFDLYLSKQELAHNIII